MKKILSSLIVVCLFASIMFMQVSAATVDSVESTSLETLRDYMQLNKQESWNYYMYHGADDYTNNKRYGGNRDVTTDSATGYEYGSVEFLNKCYFGIVAGGSYALTVSELDTENTFVLVTMRVKEGTTKPETIYIRAGVQDNYYSMVKNNIADKVKVGEWSTITVSLKELLGNSKLGNFEGNDTWQEQAAAKINNIRVQCINSADTTEKSVIEVAQVKMMQNTKIYTWSNGIINGAKASDSIRIAYDGDKAKKYTLANMNNDRLKVSASAMTENNGYMTFTPSTETSSAVGFGTLLHKDIPASGDIASELFIRVKFRSENMPTQLRMIYSVRDMNLFDNAKFYPIEIKKSGTTGTWTDYEDGWTTVDVPVNKFGVEWWWEAGLGSVRKIGSVAVSFEGYADGTYAAPVDVKEVAVYGPKQEFVVKDFKVLNQNASGDTAATNYAAGETLTLKAVFKNTVADTKNIKIVAALYDKNGENMIAAKALDVPALADPNDNTFTGEFTVDSDVSDTIVKAFLMSDFASLTPLTNCIDNLSQN